MDVFYTIAARLSKPLGGRRVLAIRNVGDAREVEDALGAILGAESEEDRAREIRRMFVETLNFEVVTEGERIPLDWARHDALPADARRLASRDGMSAIYIPIDSPRVGAMPAGAAAKKIGNVLEGEFLMLLTNRDCNQLHIIHPDLSGRRPRLRRIVVHKGEAPHRRPADCEHVGRLRAKGRSPRRCDAGGV